MIERRRAGRRDYSNPELIKLLRFDAGDQAETRVQAARQDPDPLRAAAGIILAVGLSLPLWAIVGLLVREAVRWLL